MFEHTKNTQKSSAALILPRNEYKTYVNVKPVVTAGNTS